jgi:UDP-N-acetylmuramoyl-tripeptide--D-alanyl-D-alanine ligase
MPEDTDYAVIEVGMSSAGEISPLSVLANPDIAIITNVEAVHLEFFNSIEGIADAKSEIFDGLKKNGIAILNRDNRHYLRVKENAVKKKINNIKSFGRGEGAEYQLIDYSKEGDKNKVVALINNEKVSYNIEYNGLHMALNSVAVLGALDSLGASLSSSIDSFEKLKPKEGRGKILSINFNNSQVHIIDETYNASPASVKAALEVLKNLKSQKSARSIAILGDMLELGEDSEKMHGNLSSVVESSNVDILVTVGVFTKTSNDIKKIHLESSSEIFNSLKNELIDNDIILIKGSRSMEMEKFIDDLKNGDK